MPSYRLRRILRFTDGRSGVILHGATLEAETLEQAIKQTEMQAFPSGSMTLSVEALVNKAGLLVWFRRSDDELPGWGGGIVMPAAEIEA
jgi:hypothetical protein